MLEHSEHRRFKIRPRSSLCEDLYKKMFGEYALYHNEVVVAFLCDNQFYLKPHPQLRAMLEQVNEAPPYPGAKGYYLLSDELDNPQQLGQLIRTAAQLFPVAKKRAPKKSAQSL